MLDAKVQTADPHVRAALELVQAMLADFSPRNFAIRFWDGSLWEEEAGQPRRFTLVLNHAGALRKMFMPPTELNLGEAFIFGDFDVEGDLQAALAIGERVMQDWDINDMLRFGWRLLRLPSTPHSTNGRQAVRLAGGEHSLQRDRAAIQYHYDVSNEFYKLFLDKNLVYSCAYFASADDSLDVAQERKLDYLCRKLRLQEGETLLDIGCGWGGLIIHAAKNYGVTATGITLSERQAEHARQRIKDEGLEDRITVEIRDYREMEPAHQFDKIVSVGMFEHVGRKMLPVYFEQAHKLLKPGGVFMNHGIAGLQEFEFKVSSFINEYVFPDGELVPINVTIRAAEQAGFEVRDIESLREHYTLTLKHWVERLEHNKSKALQHVDRVTYRVWRIYMSGARRAFEIRYNNLYQVLLAKPDNCGNAYLPLTRADWYANGA